MCKNPLSVWSRPQLWRNARHWRIWKPPRWNFWSSTRRESQKYVNWHRATWRQGTFSSQKGLTKQHQWGEIWHELHLTVTTFGPSFPRACLLHVAFQPSYPQCGLFWPQSRAVHRPSFRHKDNWHCYSIHRLSSGIGNGYRSSSHLSILSACWWPAIVDTAEPWPFSKESGGAGRTALDETDVKGAFKRVNSVWRNHIEEGGEFSPASGRNLAIVEVRYG